MSYYDKPYKAFDMILEGFFNAFRIDFWSTLAFVLIIVLSVGCAFMDGIHLIYTHISR